MIIKMTWFAFITYVTVLQTRSIWGRILCVCWVSKLPAEPAEVWLGWSVESPWLGHHGLNAAPEQSFRANWAAQSCLQCLHKSGRQGTGPAGDLCSAGIAPRLRGEGKNKQQMPQCGQESSPTLPTASQDTTDHRLKVFSWLPFSHFHVFVQICKQKPFSLFHYASLRVCTSSYNSFLQRLDAPTKTCICLLTFSGQHLFCQALVWCLRYTEDKYHCTHACN